MALTATQESFIKKMKESDELEWRGFQLLLERADYAPFFDVLQNEGFFQPERNPAPVPGERENTVRIPFWAPLNYLKAVARKAGEANDLALAANVVGVIRDVSCWRDEKNEPRHNYHTNHIFAEILGLVPTASVCLRDIDLLAQWVNDPYERMLVVEAVDKGLLERLLGSANTEDWNKAARVLYHMMAITWRRRDGEREPEPMSVADDFWLGELIKHHAKESGRKARDAAAEVMLGRVREVFSTPLRRDYSSVFRPAVGEAPQNYRWRSIENRVIEGLRDVMLGWSEEDVNAARAAVRRMVRDELEIIRRVGIYVLGQRWATMGSLYGEIVGSSLFSKHSHELYHLLQDHFSEMDDDQRVQTFRAVEGLPRSGDDGEGDELHRHAQYRWLSAIVGKGYAPVDQRHAELNADPKVGRLSEHPDFDSYISGGWVGPGPTPYSSEELVALTEAGAIAESLAAFTPSGDWFGEGSNGLSSALDRAAQTSPDVFLRNLDQFLSAKPDYQYAVLSGLKGAWEAKTNANWAEGWQHLVSFFERLSSEERFWSQTEDSKRWVVSAVSDFLRAGTSDDEHAYEPQLLPRTQGIIAHLLGHQPGATSAADDPMTQALNTPKGRIIEALFSQALRAARVSEREENTHAETWKMIRPLFETELTKCRNANYEFSTLGGNYLPQLQYLDGDWTKRWVSHIFPVPYEGNTVCALDGLSYAAFTRSVYELLAECGVIDRALGLELKGRNARGKLLERIGAAYLWGVERLDGQRLTRLFSTATADDLEVLTRVFWMVRDGNLSDEQRERILAFWERGLDWAKHQPQLPSESLSTLSLLAVHITTLGARERRLLESVAPHIDEGHESYEFIAQLRRLADQDPAAVIEILERVVVGHVPDYDYEERLRKLLEFLAEHGQRERVIRLCGNPLHHVQGIKPLFDKLTGRVVPGT